VVKNDCKYVQVLLAMTVSCKACYYTSHQNNFSIGTVAEESHKPMPCDIPRSVQEWIHNSIATETVYYYTVSSNLDEVTVPDDFLMRS